MNNIILFIFSTVFLWSFNQVNGIPLTHTFPVYSESKGVALGGRAVSLPAKTYRQAFKSTLSLGQCPLVRSESGVAETCTAEFSGTEVFIAKSGMTVDVTRVDSSEDVVRHVAGGFGVSVGVLGLASVGVKVKVSVTTQTSKRNLNLMSNYQLQKGVVTLQNPTPKMPVSGSALFLSEIELGGDEMMLVTLEFESIAKKVEVEVTITFKVLFISISAKLNFVHRKLNAKARVRIQFRSSWRADLDLTYSDLKSALPKVEEIEDMYVNGPQKLRDMKLDDPQLHSFYYFSSWNQSPYGEQFNSALINHDLELLQDQNIEMQSVMSRIESTMKRMILSKDQKKQLSSLSDDLEQRTKRLTKGLNQYHKLSLDERQELRDIYGTDRAPFYYSRELNIIIGE